jgi:hypothetical protein
VDQHKVIKEDEIWELRKEGNVVVRDLTGTSHAEAVQSLPSPVFNPELEILKGVVGVEKHFFVVAPQSVHRKAFLAEFDDRIEKLPAAWAAVNIIAEQIKRIPWVQTNDIFQQGAECASTAMEVGYDETAFSHVNRLLFDFIDNVLTAIFS